MLHLPSWRLDEILPADRTIGWWVFRLMHACKFPDPCGLHAHLTLHVCTVNMLVATFHKNSSHTDGLRALQLQQDANMALGIKQCAPRIESTILSYLQSGSHQTYGLGVLGLIKSHSVQSQVQCIVQQCQIHTFVPNQVDLPPGWTQHKLCAGMPEGILHCLSSLCTHPWCMPEGVALVGPCHCRKYKVR